MGRRKTTRPRDAKGRFLPKITAKAPVESPPAQEPDRPLSLPDDLPRSATSVQYSLAEPSLPLTPDPLAPTGPVKRLLFPPPRHPITRLVIDPTRPPKVYSREDRAGKYPSQLLGEDTSRINTPAIPYDWHPQHLSPAGNDRSNKPQFVAYREPPRSVSPTPTSGTGKDIALVSPSVFELSPSSNRTLSPISVTSLLAQLEVMDDQPETSRQGAQRGRQNPTGVFGGDARSTVHPTVSEPRPEPPRESSSREPPRQSTWFTSSYTTSDHLRDAALLLEVANEMGMNEYPDLVQYLTDEHVIRAKELLSRFSPVEIESRRTQAVPRIDRVTKTIRSFDSFLTRFSAGPTHESPTRPTSRVGYDRSERQHGNVTPVGANTPRWSPKRPRTEPGYEWVGRSGPYQSSWQPTAQPVETNPGLRVRDQGRDRNSREHRPDHRASTPQLKIEHQIFIYNDSEPVSAYISKLDHLAQRVGVARVLDHLGIGILLDGKSAGAKWFMALSTEEKGRISSDYEEFKKLMKKRFGKDRNTMMIRGDNLKHSFENEDKFSANDYIDEKVKWYNEAGSLSEDWQALRVYNGLDDHLKVRITMHQNETNTISDLRNQVAEHREAAYEDFRRRREWQHAQEKTLKDHSRQIQEMKSIMSRQQSVRQPYKPNDNAGAITATPVSISPQLLNSLKKIPLETNVVKREGWVNPRTGWNNRNGGNRNGWTNNNNRNYNNTNGNAGKQIPQTVTQTNPGKAQSTPTVADSPKAEVFLVQGQNFLVDGDNAYQISDENLDDVLDQINEFQEEYDHPSDLPPSVTPEVDENGTSDDAVPLKKE